MTGPRRPERAQNALAEDPRDLLEGLNYTIERDTDHSYVLKHTEDGRESAVAVFLEEQESFEHKQDRFVGDSPVAYALRQAEQRNLDYVIGSSGDQLRALHDESRGWLWLPRPDRYIR